jgi:tRNA(Arg) A34 adenosine deaminase TadA
MAGGDTIKYRPPVKVRKMELQPTTVEFSLPEWLPTYMSGHEVILDLEERMDFVIDASRRNIEEGTGGPFSAAIFEQQSGALLVLGVNLVTPERLSVLHAEIVAITLAQRLVGTYDLGAEGLPQYELVSSTEPCAMCLGAISFSGVNRVVVGARDADARQAGFDEGAKPDDWVAALNTRGIEVIRDLQRKDARRVLADYVRQGGILYT